MLNGVKIRSNEYVNLRKFKAAIQRLLRNFINIICFTGALIFIIFLVKFTIALNIIMH